MSEESMYIKIGDCPGIAVYDYDPGEPEIFGSIDRAQPATGPEIVVNEILVDGYNIMDYIIDSEIEKITDDIARRERFK